MSIEQMRAILHRKYAGYIRGKNINQMSDGQIRSIYMRLLNAGKLQGVTL